MTEQDILDWINEYTSDNGVAMIRGKHFDWEKCYYSHGDPNTWDRYIYLGNFDDKSAWYLRKEKILQINGVKLYCETPEAAEELVLAYAKANNKELGYLYTAKHIKT